MSLTPQTVTYSYYNQIRPRASNMKRYDRVKPNRVRVSFSYLKHTGEYDGRLCPSRCYGERPGSI